MATPIKQITTLVVFVLLMLLLSACSPSEKSITADQAIVEYDLLYTLTKEVISFEDELQPILSGIFDLIRDQNR